MIEFQESEYANSPLSDQSLRLVAFLLEVKPMIVPDKHLYCYLDRKPIAKSKAYQLICKFIGKKAANKLTYKDY